MTEIETLQKQVRDLESNVNHLNSLVETLLRKDLPPWGRLNYIVDGPFIRQCDNVGFMWRPNPSYSVHVNQK